MALETERKYLYPDLNRLRERLPRINAVFVRRDWEDNLVLDTPERTLRRDHILLRLRHAGVSTLILKKKASVHFNEPQHVKALEELETIVADGTAMRAILESLDFVAAFKYEKFRETWQWRKCTCFCPSPSRTVLLMQTQALTHLVKTGQFMSPQPDFSICR